MATKELDKITVLSEQIKQLQAELDQEKNARREKVLEDVRKQVKLFDITIEEIGFVTKSIKKIFTRASPKPKYQNPANIRETWSGRGKQPQWIKKSGLSLDKLVIKE